MKHHFPLVIKRILKWTGSGENKFFMFQVLCSVIVRFASVHLLLLYAIQKTGRRSP